MIRFCPIILILLLIWNSESNKYNACKITDNFWWLCKYLFMYWYNNIQDRCVYPMFCVCEILQREIWTFEYFHCTTFGTIHFIIVITFIYQHHFCHVYRNIWCWYSSNNSWIISGYYNIRYLFSRTQVKV